MALPDPSNYEADLEDLPSSDRTKVKPGAGEDRRPRTAPAKTAGNQAPRRRKEDQRWVRGEQRLQQLLLYILGVAGTINELWYEEEPRPLALLFISTLLGIPFAVRSDQLRRIRSGPQQ